MIDRPEHGSPAVWVDRLDHDGQPLTVETHATCPGHAGYVRADSWSDRIDTAYVCTDPAAHGHNDRYASSPTPTGQPGGPLTEEQKAERRQIIENNKALKAATETRREFLRDLLTRRTAPKGVLRYLTDVLTGSEHNWLLVRWYNSIPNQAERAVREALPSPNGPVAESRLPLALLTQIGGAIETTIDPQSWRHPDRCAAGWLGFLTSVGYEPAAIEQQIIDAAPAPRTDDQAADGDPPTDEGSIHDE